MWVLQLGSWGMSPIFGICPFLHGRIVSLLSKFRLSFHEVHILPDINQKRWPEQ